MKPVMNLTSATVKAATRGTPRPGQLIGDRYKLDRPLERGAMGSVWRAEQVRLRAPVAVKFLEPSLIGDREMHDRFIQEARSSAAVRSAHVVQVFDYGSEDGVPYIAMELLDGENLDARLGSRGTLTPAELAKLFTEVARGIGQAHAIGVIHRDLKPGNIFIAREGEHEVTKIVDFGIAKVKASALRLTQGIGTQLGTLLGTPQYMSPEQVRGSGSIDHRTDLWALAVIACECLTGRCPFSGATIGDLTVQICTEKPPAPSSFGPVPSGFDQWFFKATQKKPNKRFQSVEEMATRLHAVLGPAILAAPGANRGGRLITFPSRSEVRLAYSAVVTWKGYVVNRLGESWLELQRYMQRIGHYLAIQWEVASQRLRELLESERLAFLRPMVERHGMLASVALLCCGILLLGLTARSADPLPPAPAPPQTASAQAEQAPSPARLTTTALALGGSTPAQAPSTRNGVNATAVEASPLPGDGASPRSPSPARADDAAAVEASPNPAPVLVEVPSSAAAAPRQHQQPAPARALDSFVLPKAAVEHDASDAAKTTAAPPARPRASITRNAAPPSTAPKQPAPSAESATASRNEKNEKPVTKAPMTKAMAQAAAKILSADDLVAAAPAPAKKPAPRAVPQRPARAAAKPAASHKASDPFDDRL